MRKNAFVMEMLNILVNLEYINAIIMLTNNNYLLAYVFHF